MATWPEGGKSPGERKERSEGYMIRKRVKSNEMTRARQRQNRCWETYTHTHTHGRGRGGSIKKEMKKEIGSASRETFRGELRKTDNLRGQGDPRRVWRHQEGTTDVPPFRRANAIFHGRYGAGSLPEAGSGIGESAKRARERNKAPAGRASRVYSRAKKRGLISPATEGD